MDASNSATKIENSFFMTGDLDDIVDKRLHKLGHQRRIVAGLSSFLSPARSSCPP